MVTIPRLPVELIVLILRQGFLTYDFDDLRHGPDSRFLKECSLVCRTWKKHAQALLFLSVEFHGLHLSAFLSTLEHCPTLGRHVVHFTSSDHVLESTRLHLQTTSGDISHGSRHVDYYASVSNDVHDTLALVQPLRTLTNLVVLDWACDRESDSIYFLLSLWPSLRALTIRGQRLPVPARNYSIRCRIDELCLDMERNLSMEGLTVLLQSSAYTLHTLILARPIPSTLFRTLIGVHAFSLRCITFRHPIDVLPDIGFFQMDDDTNTPLVIFDTLRSCARLTELRFEVPFVEMPEGSELPRALKKLHFAIAGKSTWPSVVVGAMQKLPALKQVSCLNIVGHWDPASDELVVLNLKDWCDAAHVRWKMYTEPSNCARVLMRGSILGAHDVEELEELRKWDYEN